MAVKKYEPGADSVVPPVRRASGARPVSDGAGDGRGSILDRIGYDDSGVEGHTDWDDLSFARRGLATGDAEGSVADTLLPRYTMGESLGHSGGFYSRVVPAAEEVHIPGPPRLPELDLEACVEGPPPATSRQSSAPEEENLGVHRLFVPPVLRYQAEAWRVSGVLQLTASVSPRQARALQRALLLALLQESGWAALPEGLRQRAAWMFRDGWASGSKQLAADDLCLVLGLALDESSRELLRLIPTECIPDGAILPPSSPRWSLRP